MDRNTRESIQYLLQQHLERRASAAELASLGRWLVSAEVGDADWLDLMEELMAVEPPIEEYNPVTWQPLIEQLIQRIENERSSVHPLREKPGGRHVRMWLGRVAAAAVLLVGIGLFLILKPSGKLPQPLTPQPAAAVAQDVPAPKQARATITLADGRQIALDSAASGQLASQGKVAVMKLADGQLAYQTSGRQSPQQVNVQEVFYNTLSNPRGSRVVTLTLVDGTRVWLNAASSIRYPTAFVGGDREIQVTGEAYFEVAEDPARPFIVKHGPTAVTVLGTNFNINSYDDEPTLDVTLVSGKVRIGNNNGELVLRPGEQARVGGGIRLVRNADLDAVMAWKNGRFRFGGSSVEEVMRQVARWYDVDIIYQGKPKELHFGGGIVRTADVSQVLDLLQSTEAIHFRIDGRRITVIN